MLDQLLRGDECTAGKRKVAVKPDQATRPATDLPKRWAQLAGCGGSVAALCSGWSAYFRLAQTPKVRRELDQWLRHRLGHPAQTLETRHDHVQGTGGATAACSSTPC
ncbi:MULTISPECIES: group II intron maturase-specific domain-containing protein [unclassified Afipia]|uniref:group II intron maturase-specific domain-containing protein n=1 Tax=unclassified Afipia TaxID=2642050 RepID=UPI001FCCA62B|nr:MULTISPECIES: group II intron maturase-specific domain-containing protein [unclassified Afipia]